MSTNPDPEPPQPGRFALNDFLPYKLNLVASSVSEQLSRVYVDTFQISIPEWRIIATLAGYRVLTSKDIGIKTCMDKTKVSRAISSLESRGLLRRHTCQNDKRAGLVQLSEAGDEIFARLAPLALQHVATLTEGIDSNDLAVFYRVLDALIERSRHQSIFRSS